jgi:copper chaperone CopZ
MAVTKALEETGALKNVKVDLKKGEATFDEAGPVDMEKIREQIKKAGYDIG